MLAFEGHAHPFKKNLLQYPGQHVKSILELESGEEATKLRPSLMVEVR